MKNFACLSFLCLGAITGCVLQPRESKPKNAYLFDVPAPAVMPVQWPVPVQIRACRAHAPLADTPLVNRLSRVRYEQDYFNTFLVPPTEQIQALLVHRLGGGRQGEAPRKNNDREWVLQSTLERLWGDFTDPNQACAEVQIHFLLTEISHQERSQRVILDDRFRARQEIAPEPNAEELVTQLSLCLARVLTEFETTLNDRVASGHADPGSSDP